MESCGSSGTLYTCEAVSIIHNFRLTHNAPHAVDWDCGGFSRLPGGLPLLEADFACQALGKGILGAPLLHNLSRVVKAGVEGLEYCCHERLDLQVGKCLTQADAGPIPEGYE